MNSQNIRSINMTDILTYIQENMSTFSKGQKLIANYILQSYDKAAFMTASKLGKTVNVSESTVVQFCRRAGIRRISQYAKDPSGNDPQ